MAVIQFKSKKLNENTNAMDKENKSNYLERITSMSDSKIITSNHNNFKLSNHITNANDTPNGEGISKPKIGSNIIDDKNTEGESHDIVTKWV